MDNNHHRLSCAVCAARHNNSPVLQHSPTGNLRRPLSPSSTSVRPRSPSTTLITSTYPLVDSPSVTAVPIIPSSPSPAYSSSEERMHHLEQQLTALTNENNQRKKDIQNLLGLVHDLVTEQRTIKEENQRLYHHLENIFREIERNAKEPVTVPSSPSSSSLYLPSPSAVNVIPVFPSSPSPSMRNYPPPYDSTVSTILPASPYAMKALAQETARLRSLAVLNSSASSSSSYPKQ